MKNNTDVKSKIIDKKSIHKSKYFSVDKVSIERNGKIFTKDIISRTPAVIIIPVNEKDEIYLVSQYRDSMQEILLETVAGHMEKGDTPLQAAKKELQQETGLTAKTWKQLTTFYVSANMDSVVHVFYATALEEGERDLDYDEEIEVIKMPFEEALKKIDTGEMRVTSNIASLLLLERWKRQATYKK